MRRYVLRAVMDDLGGRPVTARWRVFGGRNVSVAPISPDGSMVVVEIPWQTPLPTPRRPDLTTSRVDVALFADNGAALSAPAFFSVYHPQDQIRRHDDEGAVLEIDYVNQVIAGAYADPLLLPLRHWRDAFDYDPEGRLLGWTRHHRGRSVDFCRQGHRVVSRDLSGRPTHVRPVTYRLERPDAWPRRRMRVTYDDTDEDLVYRYDGPGDRFGLLSE
jgi:hypothetical protein